MKRRGGTTIIGLAFGERGDITVAEVSAGAAGDGAGSLNRAGRFEASAADPAAQVGAALRKFLKEQKFSAGKAVLGLPAKWVIARERQVPPAAPDAAAALLRLQAERQFPPELREMTFDYAGQTNPSEARTVLLLASPKQQVDRAIQVAQTAGLTPVAVTSSALALSAALGGHAGHVLVSISPESAELVVRSDGAPRVLRQLSVTGQQLASTNGAAAAGFTALSGELLRTVSVSGGANAPGVILWDGVGLQSSAVTSLGSRFSGLSLTSLTDLRKIDVGQTPAGSGDLGQYGAAAAVALAGIRPELLAVDFLHSRLAPPRERKLGKKVIYGAAGAALLLLLIGYALYDTHQKQSEIDRYKALIAANKPKVDDAEALALKLRTADGWYTKRPPILDALEHISGSFPQEGIIWANEFNFRESIDRKPDPRNPGKYENVILYKGKLGGKATSRQAILTVSDTLKNDRRFTDVQLGEMHEGTGKDRDITFSLTFTFNEQAK